jgi:hypothetical protein
VDFDKFLLARIREFKVICQHMDNASNKLEIMVDPERAAEDIVVRLGQVTAIIFNVQNVQSFGSGSVFDGRLDPDPGGLRRAKMKDKLQPKDR